MGGIIVPTTGMHRFVPAWVTPPPPPPPPPPPVPDPDTIYGPHVLGATMAERVQYVRDNAKPLAVTQARVPAGAITVYPTGTSGQPYVGMAGLQAALIAYPAQTAFMLTPGIYTQTVQADFVQVDGKKPDIWCLDGVIIDGPNRVPGNTTTMGSIQSERYGQFGAGMNIHGGLWRNFLGPNTSGDPLRPSIGQAIVLRGPGIIEDVQGTANGSVLGTDATGTIIIRRCRFWHNGSTGFTLFTHTGQASNRFVYNCEIADNNFQHWNPMVASAATKIFGNYLSTTECYQNWWHDNYGFGQWHDYGGGDTNTYDSVMENNLFSGLIYEMSSAGLVGSSVHHCYLVNNGNEPAASQAMGWSAVGGWAAQLYISDSGNREYDPYSSAAYDIYRNYVDTTLTGFSNWSRSAAIIVQQGRPSSATTHNQCTRKVHVRDNDIWLRGVHTWNSTSWYTPCGFQEQESVNGGVAGNEWPLREPGHDNTFKNNSYHVGDTNGTYWKADVWPHPGGYIGDNTYSAANNWAGWQGMGFDATGTKVVI